MLKHPDLDPVIFSWGPIEPRWYGLMYVIAFVTGWFMLKKSSRRANLHLNQNDLLDLVFFVLLGVVIGGRLGYVWFYNLTYFWENPREIFALWRGGMSFHGGFLGSIFALLYFAHSRKVNFYRVSDLVVIPATLGIALVRLGNFINGELFGRPSDAPWCVLFPSRVDLSQVCRHPSQIYEMFSEGILLFALLILIRRTRPTAGIISWFFVMGYGLFRSVAEFYREPDPQIGYYFGWMSQGQLLSFPLFFLGLVMLLYIAGNYGWRAEKPRITPPKKAAAKIRGIKKTKRKTGKNAAR